MNLKQILQGCFIFLNGIINSERKESILQSQQNFSSFTVQGQNSQKKFRKLTKL